MKPGQSEFFEFGRRLKSPKAPTPVVAPTVKRDEMFDAPRS